jgi:hypothetical protein
MRIALQVTMFTYGAVGAIIGLAYMLFPQQAIDLQSPDGSISTYLVATKMALGASMFAGGILAAFAARDPIKYIFWVRYSILFAVLFLGVALYTGIVLYSDFSQALVGIIIHGVFSIALLILYPRGKAQSGVP